MLHQKVLIAVRLLRNSVGVELLAKRRNNTHISKNRTKGSNAKESSCKLTLFNVTVKSRCDERAVVCCVTKCNASIDGSDFLDGWVHG